MGKRIEKWKGLGKNQGDGDSIRKGKRNKEGKEKKWETGRRKRERGGEQEIRKKRRNGRKRKDKKG